MRNIYQQVQRYKVQRLLCHYCACANTVVMSSVCLSELEAEAVVEAGVDGEVVEVGEEVENSNSKVMALQTR